MMGMAKQMGGEVGSILTISVISLFLMLNVCSPKKGLLRKTSRLKSIIIQFSYTQSVPS